MQPAGKKRGPRRIGRTKGGLNSKLHAVCDQHGRPLVLMLTEGQVNDHKGAAALFHALPSAALLIADRGYDSDGFRAALIEKGTTPCIPTRKNRKVQIPHDAGLYRTRHTVENMFAKLKDWRKLATRYDRCSDIFMGTIIIAATVIFWLPK